MDTYRFTGLATIYCTPRGLLEDSRCEEGDSKEREPGVRTQGPSEVSGGKKAHIALGVHSLFHEEVNAEPITRRTARRAGAKSWSLQKMCVNRAAPAPAPKSDEQAYCQGARVGAHHVHMSDAQNDELD